MKTKTFILVAFASIFFVLQSFGKEKKTVIQRINEAGTIPVYIELPVIDFDKFNSSSSEISLTPNENKLNESKHITKKASGIYDSIVPYIIIELNKSFKTTKFVEAPIKELPITDKNLMDVNDPDAKLIVVVKINAKYVYEYMINKPSRNDDKDLVSTMCFRGGFSYDFFLINVQNHSKRSIAMNGGYVYGNEFKVIGIPTDIATLEKKNDSTKLSTQFKNVISERISKHAEKLLKKDAKAKKN